MCVNVNSKVSRGVDYAVRTQEEGINAMLTFTQMKKYYDLRHVLFNKFSSVKKVEFIHVLTTEWY